LAIDSKLRACDLMQLRVRDVCHGVDTGHCCRVRWQPAKSGRKVVVLDSRKADVSRRRRT
jgi:hypothetical protein